jgi:hypothetical protein
MNTLTRLICVAWAFGVVLSAGAQEPTRPIHYAVSFKNAPVATQTVTIVHADDTTTLTTSFETELPVFIARHRYAESASVTFRPDGTVERFHAVRRDGALATEVSGSLNKEGDLEIVRTDRSGTTSTRIQREDYDFHSLILYGTAPSAFLPEHQPARILDIQEGRVVPVTIQSMEQSHTTPERQHVASRKLTWTREPFTSHSWHPERHSNLPIRYIRHTENGTFTFQLQR